MTECPFKNGDRVEYHCPEGKEDGAIVRNGTRMSVSDRYPGAAHEKTDNGWRIWCLTDDGRLCWFLDTFLRKYK